MNRVLEAPAVRGTERTPPPVWRVALALARVEGRRLVRHPILLAGAALTILGLGFSEGEASILPKDDAAVGLMFFPLAGMTLIAVNLATLRGRRHHTEEQYASHPASRSVRTAAHLVSALWPMALAALLLVLWYVFVKLDGAIGRPNILELATGPVLVGGATAVGVLVARWVPRGLAGPMAVAAIGGVEAALLSGSETAMSRWLAPFVPPIGDLPDELWVRRPAIHLVYLGALIAVIASLAFLGHGRRGRAAVALGVSVAVLAASGWAQTRPISDTEVDRFVAFIERPDDAQVCETRDRVRYCAYPAYRALIDRWQAPVSGVLARVPADGRILEVRQRVLGRNLSSLPREVTGRLSPAVPHSEPFAWADDGSLHPEMRWCGGKAETTCGRILASAAAAWAVGLPLASTPSPAPCPGDEPCPGIALQPYDSAGEARPSWPSG